MKFTKEIKIALVAIFGILVNIRYQVEKSNSVTPPQAAAHLARKKFYLQYQSDGE